MDTWSFLMQGFAVAEPVGPRPFPLLLLGLMAICAVMMLLRKPDVIQWPSATTFKKLIVLCILLMAYGWQFEHLGFPLCTTRIQHVWQRAGCLREKTGR
ncbi:hypothetical protein CRX72_23740 [Pantoea sp. BRM17]|nr:hypothetical protein CRX72_23740 [Pantoea sp. BRM17]